ncbi:hypothetical protein BD413DRAFT_490384 [Trametes elegans]|nr:hypothetical protein BD413DRAFT_490384 [Trametes elegans]
MSSPTPASPSVSAGPRPLQLVDGNAQPSCSSCPSPTASGLSTPPPSARKYNPRRQSSIAYYPSNHSPTWDLRSPTTPSSGSSLKRSTSLNHSPSERPSLKRDRRSLPATNVLEGAQTERPPLTLTEKHADLLHFIAQKESKCLELRSQLAAHEAELAQLKRKWERIVSRGMDRAYSQPPHSGAASSSLLSGAMKEGVSRLFGDLAAAAAAVPPPTPSKPEPRTPILPLRTGRASTAPAQGHATTQSTSSVSTAATSSLAGSSVRLSQSSASSLALDEADETANGRAAGKRTSISVDGGTGIESPVEISPAGAARAAKLHRRKSRDAPQPPPSPEPTFAHAELPSPAASAVGGKERERERERAAMTLENRQKTIKRSSLQVAAGGMPPAASIPGLGPLASPRASAWMGSVGSSVGKKWEEIQKGETWGWDAHGEVTHPHICSIDRVHQEPEARLAPPLGRLQLDLRRARLARARAFVPAFSSPHGTPAPVPSSVSITSNPFAATLSPLSSSPTPPPALASRRAMSVVPATPSAQSLLEADDGDAGRGLGSVLVPDRAPHASARTLTHKSTGTSAGGRTGSGVGEKTGEGRGLLDDGDDEEWNW